MRQEGRLARNGRRRGAGARGARGAEGPGTGSGSAGRRRRGALGDHCHARRTAGFCRAGSLALRAMAFSLGHRARATGAGKGGETRRAALRRGQGVREAEEGARAGLTSRGNPSGLVGPAGRQGVGTASGPRGMPGARSLGNRAGPAEQQRTPPGLERRSHKWRREGRSGSDAGALPAAWAGLRVSFLGYRRTEWKVRVTTAPGVELGLGPGASGVQWGLRDVPAQPAGPARALQAAGEPVSFSWPPFFTRRTR